MKDMFVLKSEICLFDNVEDFLRKENVDENDLIITNRFIFDDKYKTSAHLIFQEEYGKGEPTDVMVESIRKDIPLNIKRIIAIGGGTVIDISKFLILDYDGKIDQVINREIPFNKVRSLYVVPTTVGTGSEVTNVAICEMIERKTKKGLADDLIYPDKAALIPELVKTLPYKFFATSSIDALIHSIESFVSPNATYYSRIFSKETMTIILGCYKKVVSGENWNKYAKDFLYASNLAGIAFNNAGCGAVHALSYPLGGTYHIPHGEANMLMFEAVFKKYREKDPSGKINDLYFILSNVLCCDKEDALDEMFKLLDLILKRNPLNTYGVKKEELAVFAKSVIQNQGRLLTNNYTPLSEDEMLEIYESVFDK